MSPGLVAPDASFQPLALADREKTSTLRILTWGALTCLLVLQVPLFLNEGLDADVTLWDLCAKNVIQGGVHYRDAVENNFPGMLWLHLALRLLLGWSSLALRIVDLAVVTVIFCLLIKATRTSRENPSRLWLALALFGFYLATSEWCHVQRDVWMLLPVLAAVLVRERFLLTVNKCSSRSWIVGALLDGVLWACAFWIKPHVAVPGIVLLILDQGFLWPAGKGIQIRLVYLAAYLTGGIVVGLLGILWLVKTGAWPYFVEIVIHWNRDYVRYDFSEQSRWLALAGPAIRLFPWILIHLAALPVSLILAKAGIQSAFQGIHLSIDQVKQTRLAALYLAWMGQAVFFQHLFDYIHVPGIILGIAVVFSVCPKSSAISLPIRLSAATLLTGLVLLPAFDAERLKAWPDCLLLQPTPAIRNQVTRYRAVDWVALDQVKDFLAENGAGDGEVTCLTSRTVAIYELLKIRPSTRFYYLESALRVLPKQRPNIEQALDASRQRFIVYDLARLQLDLSADALAQLDLTTLPAWNQPVCPWSKSLVFRKGRYIVLEVPAHDMGVWVEAFLN